MGVLKETSPSSAWEASQGVNATFSTGVNFGTDLCIRSVGIQYWDQHAFNVTQGSRICGNNDAGWMYASTVSMSKNWS